MADGSPHLSFSHISNRQHEKDAHPQLACRLCDGRLVYIDELEGHYLESKNYPTCSSCLVGFQDQFSYEEVGSHFLSWGSREQLRHLTCQHIDSLHPELQKCSLAYPASTIPEYHSEDPPEYPHPVSGEDSNDMECSHDSRDVDEESVVTTNLYGIRFLLNYPTASSASLRYIFNYRDQGPIRSTVV